MIKKHRNGSFNSMKIHNTKPELAVESQLKQMSVRFEKQKRIKSKQFDFYLPDYNMLIEVDGEYWHSLPKAVKNDKFKNNLAKNERYKLTRIWAEDVYKNWRIIW